MHRRLFAFSLFFAATAMGADVEITGDVTPSPASSPTWVIPDQLVVGLTGNGTMAISGNGSVSNPSAIIANGASSVSSVSVSSGSWTNSSFLAIGIGGSAALQISGTGGVFSSTTALASNAGSIGSLQLLGGTLTTAQVSEGLGNGTVNFNGGTLRLSGNQGSLFNGFENGDVTINGPGGGAIDTQSFNVATALNLTGTGLLTKRGTGTLTLTGNNSMSGGVFVRGGSLVLDGGALNHSGAGVYVGRDGGENATLTNNGATITTNLISLGDNSGATGHFTMNAGTVNNSFEVWVGNAGTGSLTFTGGTISNTIGNIARLGGSTGSVTMSGGTWNNSQFFVVGNNGNGSFVQSGGTVNTPLTVIGRLAGGNGNATITGGNWNNTGNFIVGELGAGQLNLNGGVVTAAQFLRGGSSGTMSFNGGTIRLNGNQSDLFAGFQPGDITLTGLGGTIDTQGFNVATSVVIAGAGPLTKTGAGRLTLGGNQTYTGATNVQAGRLVVDGTLASSGVTVANGAILSPGTGVSTLSLNSLALNDTSYLDFQLATPGIVGGGVNDLIQVNGNLVLGGLLNIEALTGFGTGNYRLIDYTGSLANNKLLFGNVPGGFEYAVNTATANQVNLTVSIATAQYWDGPNTTPQGVPFGSGGTGTWAERSTNWTNAAGNANSNSLQNLPAIFGGTGGTVTIADGSTVRASALTFEADGYAITAAGNGTLELVGAGLVDTKANDVTISAPLGGNSTLIKQGTGSLTLTADNTVIGGVSVRSGSMRLTSTGALRTYPLTVGLNSGDNATLVNDGGFISSRLATLGESAGSVGNATISGGTWNNTSEFRVGNAGTGHLTISGGTINTFATPNTGDNILNVGRLAGSNGTVTMTGGTLSVFEVNIGNAGEGTLVMSGGTLNSLLRTYIGRQDGGVGHVQLSGNATWNHRFDFLVGGGATGTLEISDNAKLNILSRWMNVGGGAFGTSAGNGTVLMTGGSITMAGGLRIGEKGTGVFTLSNGTVVGPASSLIGGSGGTGTVNMTGGTWTAGNSSYGILIGNGLNSNGTLNLSGGTINNTIAHVGAGGSGGGIGIANVSGGTWNNSNEFRVGDGSGGNGTLNLTGGTITSSLGNIGRDGGSQGVVNASGGIWTNTSQLIIGNAGNGTVTISGTTEVSASETIVGRQGSGVGSLTLAGGRFITGDIREELGSGTVTFDGGQLQINRNQSAFLAGFELDDVILADGGLAIDTQNFAVSLVASMIGTGGITKTGAGTLALSAPNYYAGNTEITAGTLLVNDTLSSPTVTMGNGTILTGNGNLAGVVALGSNVTINPGDGVGTLIVGSLALNASTILNFELDTPATSDRITANDNLTLDGTLNITALGGFDVGVYRLFEYGGQLTNNGLLFGVTPGAFDLTLDTSASNEVNLIVTAAAAQYWDGPNLVPQGAPQGTGGSGIWNASATNWTNAAGNANTNWAGNLGATFAGAAGTVTIADGFTAVAPSLRFQTSGYELAAAGSGSLTLSDTGLVFVQTGTAEISAPITGAGSLVKDGAGTLTLSGNNAYSGATWARKGTLDITGTVSHSGSDLAIGVFLGDVATLNISGTATVTNRTGFLGFDIGSTGNALVSGGTWTNTDELRVGDFGTGNLTITGGNISSTIGNIARSAGSTGTVIMDGGTWTNSVQFVVGNQGAGTFNLSAGTVQSDISTVGLNAGGSGTAEVTGGTWANTGELRVGDLGSGTLHIRGGDLTSTIGNIARGGGSYGAVTMSNGTWTNSDLLVVGNVGQGSLIQTGGQITNTAGEIGYGAGGLGVATVSGGTWTNTGNLTIGRAGRGTLNLLAGSTVNVQGGTVYLGWQFGSEGTLNFGSPDLDHPTAPGALDATAFVFGSGDGKIQFNQPGAFALSAPISGSGTLVQRGAGLTTITGSHSFSGSTLVHGGTLLVNGALAGSAVTISSGGTLGGSGTVKEILLESGGILAPGNSVGTLTSDTLVWQPGARLLYDLGATNADRLTLSGALTAGGPGSFQFTFQDAGWQVGQTYKLIEFGSTNFTVDNFGFSNGNGFDGTFSLDGDSLDFTLTAVPEPGTWTFLLTGLLAIGVVLYRKARLPSR